MEIIKFRDTNYGEIYKALNGNIFRKGEFDSDCYLGHNTTDDGIPCQIFTFGNGEFKSCNCTKASLLEEKWLNTCIAKNKFIRF